VRTVQKVTGKIMLAWIDGVSILQPASVMFDIVRVDRSQAGSVETMGTKRKFWYLRDGQQCLFKAEERGTGEDWAEKIVCQLCRRIALPHVEYDLADEFQGEGSPQPGVICPNCVGQGQVLVLGNQLLFLLDAAYPADGPRRYKVREYTVKAVATCVKLLTAPFMPLPTGIETALDVFVGYIALDAWVANQDRHHENWGALFIVDERALRLAPTFDHGASLARNLTDQERKIRLESSDDGRRIPYFARRAKSAFYDSVEDTKTLGTIAAFHSFAQFAPNAARIWQKIISGVTMEEIEAIIKQVPPQRMSPVARKFTLELMMENQQRLVSLSI
jgi:hypothetical protein